MIMHTATQLAMHLTIQRKTTELNIKSCNIVGLEASWSVSTDQSWMLHQSWVLVLSSKGKLAELLQGNKICVKEDFLHRELGNLGFQCQQ